MSSDDEVEPPPSKRRRHARLISSNDDSGSPVVPTLRSDQTNKYGCDNEDVFVLSDLEIDVYAPTGSTSSSTSTDSRIPSSVDLSLDKNPKNLKRSSESIKNAAKEEAAGSSTGIESDGNELAAEKCPICWVPFTNQEVANPSTCNHSFCFRCIMEWTKTTNTCPVDRQTFNDINVRPEFGSNVTRLVPVETRVSSDTDIDAEDADLEPNVDDYYDYVNESSELGSTFSIDEAEDDESFLMFSSFNDNYMSPEVVVSSPDGEVALSSPSDYNGFSPPSSPDHDPYLSPTPSTSAVSTSPSSSPYRSPSPAVSVSSPIIWTSPSPSLSSLPSLSPSFSPSPSPSPSPSISSAYSPSPSISSTSSHLRSPSMSSPSLSVSYSRSLSCSSLSNASSASSDDSS